MVAEAREAMPAFAGMTITNNTQHSPLGQSRVIAHMQQEVEVRALVDERKALLDDE